MSFSLVPWRRSSLAWVMMDGVSKWRKSWKPTDRHPGWWREHKRGLLLPPFSTVQTTDCIRLVLSALRSFLFVYRNRIGAPFNGAVIGFCFWLWYLFHSARHAALPCPSFLAYCTVLSAVAYVERPFSLLGLSCVCVWVIVGFISGELWVGGGGGLYSFASCCLGFTFPPNVLLLYINR